MLHERQNLADNHDRFVQRVAAGQIVWGLKSPKGWASCGSNQGQDQSGDRRELPDERRDVIVFWSDRAHADQVKQESFNTHEVASMPLFEFLYRWLPGMHGDGVLAGANWTPDLAGLESEPAELQQQILDALPSELMQQYQQQLKQLIDDQNQADRG